MEHSVGKLLLLHIFLYVALLILLFRAVSRLLYSSVLRARDEQNDHAQELLKASELREKITGENKQLSKTLEDTETLYAVTKAICAHLTEEEVFRTFRDVVQRHVALPECHLVKEEIPYPQDPSFLYLPLELNQRILGTIVAGPVKESEKEKVTILSHQLLLGMKRVLLYQRVQELSIMDSLTGVFSRRYLLERFREEIQRSEKFGYRFCYLMLDIDHFKRYNDRYGHLVGDGILKEIVKGIKENIRQIDLVGRYGGEEFAVVLAETDKEGGLLAAERIRQNIEKKNILLYDEKLKATVSIGIAMYPDQADTLEALIEKADAALYRAKEEGRNRICLS
jgi:diguanylate cyclase (GGDEF)-like protein